MSESDSGAGAAPYLVLVGGDGQHALIGLCLVPMMEVPSGTTGPWLGIPDRLEAAVSGLATSALEQAMAQDAITAGATGVDSVAAWQLRNTKLATAGGECFYLSPQTVCWCDSEGVPRYDCDAALLPACDMIDPSAAVPSDYEFVADERLGDIAAVGGVE